jgi:hypothetical protein
MLVDQKLLEIIEKVNLIRNITYLVPMDHILLHDLSQSAARDPPQS